MDPKWTIDLEDILRQLPGYILWKDKDSIVRGCNAHFAKWCGLSSDQIIGKHIKEIYPREFSERYRSDDLEVMRTGKGMIYMSEKPYGKSIEKLVTYKYPLRDSKAQVVGTIVFFHELQEGWLDQRNSA